MRLPAVAMETSETMVDTAEDVEDVEGVEGVEGGRLSGTEEEGSPKGDPEEAFQDSRSEEVQDSRFLEETQDLKEEGSLRSVLANFAIDETPPELKPTGIDEYNEDDFASGEEAIILVESEKRKSRSFPHTGGFDGETPLTGSTSERINPNPNPNPNLAIDRLCFRESRLRLSW